MINYNILLSSFTSVFIYLLLHLHCVVAFSINAEREIVERTNVTVELLIISDEEFSKHFQHDRQKMIEFWAANICDVNMKFKTLPSVDISFQITSFIEIKTSEQSHHMDLPRWTNGSSDLNSMLLKFGNWVYKNELLLPYFDVAILATSVNNDVSYNHIDTICTKSESKETHYSTAMVNYNSLLGNSKCNKLTRSFARLLGAPWDSETKDYRGCAKHSYIMGDEKCDDKQYFFSECSDAALAYKIKLKSASCLWKNSASSVDLIENSTRSFMLPSLEEQCVELTNDSNASIIEDENKCVATKCVTAVDGMKMVAKTFYPLDNSPCANGKICFRGRCIPEGYTISNVASGTCVNSRNNFASDDYPTMGDCIISPTPLDLFIVSKTENEGIYLSTPYSSLNGEENTEKYVSVNQGILRYRKSTPAEKKRLQWILVHVGSSGDFLLYHPCTKSCAKAEEDGFISMKKSCDVKDFFMRWTFAEIKHIPFEWLTSFSDMTEHQNATDSICSYNSITESEVPGASATSSAAIQYLNVPVNKDEDNLKTRDWKAITVATSIGILLGLIIGFTVSKFVYTSNKNSNCLTPSQFCVKFRSLFRLHNNPTMLLQNDTLFPM